MLPIAQSAVIGFGEMLAILGRDAAGGTAVRTADALGARLPAVANPWFDAVIVPPGAAPPADRADLPLCVWSADAAVPGRVAAPDLVMPCMVIDLGDRLPVDPAPPLVEAPPATVLGAINDTAYGEPSGLAALAPQIADPRIALHGVRVGADFACVALTLTLGDNLCLHYVATAAAHRRQGLAGRLVTALLHDARARGLRIATLQASSDGLPVYARLGFRTVATLQGYLRT